MESLINFGHWKASKAGTNLPAHTDAGLEFVYVANGAVQWDYEGSVVDVPAHHLSFTWPWQTHGARDTRLPAVELYWILIPLVNGKSRNKAPTVSNGIGLSAAENRQLIQLLARSLPVIAVGRRSGRHIAQLVERLQTNGNILDLKARGHLLLLLGEVQQALERSEANQDQNKERDPGLEAVRTFWEVAWRILGRWMEWRIPVDSGAQLSQLRPRNFTPTPRYESSPVIARKKRPPCCAKHVSVSPKSPTAAALSAANTLPRSSRTTAGTGPRT